MVIVICETDMVVTVVCVERLKFQHENLCLISFIEIMVLTFPSNKFWAIVCGSD